jgi:hypothetical protein
MMKTRLGSPARIQVSGSESSSVTPGRVTVSLSSCARRVGPGAEPPSRPDPASRNHDGPVNSGSEDVAGALTTGEKKMVKEMVILRLKVS